MSARLECWFLERAEVLVLALMRGHAVSRARTRGILNQIDRGLRAISRDTWQDVDESGKDNGSTASGHHVDSSKSELEP